MGLDSTSSYFSPPSSSLYSLVLKSENLTTRGRGKIALATVAIPPESQSTKTSSFPVSMRCIGCCPT